MEDPHHQLLLTVPQAAAVLAVGRTMLYELIASGEVGTVHIGRCVRVPRSELEAFVERRLSGRLPTMALTSQPSAASRR